MDRIINIEEVEKLDKEHGPARRIDYGPIKMLEWEYGLLTRSMRNGRGHDVTMFIRKNGERERFVGIQKPFYRDTGIFRAPSGGVNAGETILDGLMREMYEETGLRVEIDRLLLIIDTEFVSPDESEKKPWTSFVFLGRDVGGKFETRDPREISDMKLVTREEMLGPIAEEMTASGWGGFLYRARLTGDALALISTE